MMYLLDEGLRGYWENPAFVIGVLLLFLGALLLLFVFAPRESRSSNEPSGDGTLGLLHSRHRPWIIAEAAGAALLVAGVVFNPAFAIGGGFIVIVASVRLLSD